MGNKKIDFSSFNPKEEVKSKSWRYLNVERDLQALDEWYDIRRHIVDSINRLILIKLDLHGTINSKPIFDAIDKQHDNLKKSLKILDEVISIDKDLIILQCPKMAKYLNK